MAGGTGRIGDPERVAAEVRAVPGFREIDERIEQRLAAEPGVQLRLDIGTPGRDRGGGASVSHFKIQCHRIRIPQAELGELGHEKVHCRRRTHRRMPEKIGDPAFLVFLQPIPVGRCVGVHVPGAVGLKLGELHRRPGNLSGRLSPGTGLALEAGHINARKRRAGDSGSGPGANPTQHRAILTAQIAQPGINGSILRSHPAAIPADALGPGRRDGAAVTGQHRGPAVSDRPASRPAVSDSCYFCISK